MVVCLYISALQWTDDFSRPKDAEIRFQFSNRNYRGTIGLMDVLYILDKLKSLSGFCILYMWHLLHICPSVHPRVEGSLLCGSLWGFLFSLFRVFFIYISFLTRFEGLRQTVLHPYSLLKPFEIMCKLGFWSSQIKFGLVDALVVSAPELVMMFCPCFRSASMALKLQL